MGAGHVWPQPLAAVPGRRTSPTTLSATSPRAAAAPTRPLDLATAISSQTWRSLARNSSSKRLTSAPRATSRGPQRQVFVAGVGAQGVFSYHRLKHILVQTQFSNQLLQPSVLVTQVLDLFGFAHVHAPVPRLPGINGVLADTLFTRNILGCVPSLNLLQRSNNLRFRMPTLCSSTFPFPSSKSYSKLDGFWESITRKSSRLKSINPRCLKCPNSVREFLRQPNQMETSDAYPAPSLYFNYPLRIITQRKPINIKSEIDGGR